MVYNYKYEHSEGSGEGVLDLPSKAAVEKKIRSLFPDTAKNIKITITAEGENE